MLPRIQVDYSIEPGTTFICNEFNIDFSALEINCFDLNVKNWIKNQKNQQ